MTGSVIMRRKRTFTVVFREDFGGLTSFQVKGHKLAILDVGTVQGFKSLSLSKVRFGVDKAELVVFDLVWISEEGVAERIIDVNERR
jgi:hypothetical protein